MKITPNTNLSALHPQPSKSSNQIPPPPATVSASASAPVADPDLGRKNPAHRKPPRRRIASAARTPRLHLKKDAAGATSGKRVGPPTPLLRWKFDEVDGEEGERDLVGAGGDKSSAVGVECGGRRVRRGAKGGGGAVSVRKLAAALWRLQAPEVGGGGTQERRRSTKEEDDQLGFQQNTRHVGEQLSSHHGSRGFGSEAKGQPRSPCSVNGPTNGYTYEPQASLKFSNFAMEGATKWDPVFPEKNEEPSSFQLCNQNQNAVSKVSILQSELEQAQRRIEELELEQKSSKKKLKQFLLKLSEERAAWRSREHEKVRAIISDIKTDLIRERKNCQRLEVVNSKLVNELADVKLAMKRYMHDFEKERKNRELAEEVCDELANEIGEDKAEVEALKTECMKIREEVDDERKMLQMAEVWREERVQMKLIDAKVTLEDKYSQMNRLIADLKRFLGSKSGELDSREIKEAELLQEAAASLKIQDMKEFTYEPPKSDDIFSIFEEMGMGETSEREIEQRDANGSSGSYTLKGDKVYRLSNAYGSQNDDLDDDRSGWETVSQADDQGSSFTPEGSVTSFNKMVHRESNVSESGTEWEGNGGDEMSEVSSVRSKSSRKMSAISRLWRSGPNNGESYRVSVDGMNGRLSNGGGFMSPSDLVGQWSSPDRRIHQIARGKKGCMEWPRGQKNSLKAKLLEARVESQKIQLRQVLKQKT